MNFFASPAGAIFAPLTQPTSAKIVTAGTPEKCISEAEKLGEAQRNHLARC